MTAKREGTKGGVLVKLATNGESVRSSGGPKFVCGMVVVTSNVVSTIHAEDVRAALGRHTRGDWGNVCSEDWESNESGLREGARLFSVYHDRNGVTFCIITEWDRSYTTVLLPDEY